MNGPNRILLPYLTLLAVLCPVSGWAQEEPATVEATAHLFADTLELDGVLVPATSVVIRPEFESYKGALEVLESASPGPVVEGQILFRFNDVWYQQQLQAQKLDFELAKLDFDAKQEDAARKREFIQIAFTEAERAFKRAKDDFARYQKDDLPRRIREAQLSVQSNRDRISDQQEELAQLEKMYGEDDLTEETEEIVLRRTRRGMARSLIYLQFREERHQVFMDISLPRELDDRKLGMRKATMTFERAGKKRDADLEKARLEQEKGQLAYDKKVEALEKLAADRDQLTIRSPGAGTLVSGLFKGNKWSDVRQRGPIRELGDRVKNKQDLATFLEPQTPQIEVSVKEENLLAIKSGMTATVTPKVAPDSELAAEVESVARHGKDKYSTLLVLSEAQRDLRPGFTCKVKLKLGASEEGVGIPVGAVLKGKDGKFVVKVDGDSSEKVKVKLGREDSEIAEVVEGLAIGDRILRDPPPEADTK